MEKYMFLPIFHIFNRIIFLTSSHFDNFLSYHESFFPMFITTSLLFFIYIYMNYDVTINL